MGFLCVAFALTGLAFLLVPGSIEGMANNFGGIGAVFEPLPISECRFWNTFAFAYMVLVTALAWMAARDPESSYHLLMLLLVGKLSTSLTALALFFLERPAAGYLGTFLIDGGIVIIVVFCLRILKKEVWDDK